MDLFELLFHKEIIISIHLRTPNFEAISTTKNTNLVSCVKFCINSLRPLEYRRFALVMEDFVAVEFFEFFLGMKTHYRFLVRRVHTDITLDESCPTKEISWVGNKNVEKKSENAYFVECFRFLLF